jgi:hypothetical protein
MNGLFALLDGMNPFRRYTALCGHRTKLTGRVSAFGRSITTRMPKPQNGEVKYCLDCIGSMAIRCAWCADPIFIGDPVTLYISRKPSFEIPEHAVIHETEPLQLVGCLGWNCADTGADRAGFWMPGEDGKGKVQRVPTAYERMMGSGVPRVVITSDTHDMAEALRP